jgi:Mn2+/Fe2+ NRAMP family transporter
MLFSYPLMVAIQQISARIGRITGRGVAGNLRQHYPNWVLHIIVALLFVANTINIGADLGAMADALALLIGGPVLIYVVAFGLLCATLQVFMRYRRYVAVLRWLTLALFAYFGTIMVVRIPWGEALLGLFVPTFSPEAGFWTTVVAVLGTTISPYLFFWQAAQEAEDTRIHPERKPLSGRRAKARMQWNASGWILSSEWHFPISWRWRSLWRPQPRFTRPESLRFSRPHRQPSCRAVCLYAVCTGHHRNGPAGRSCLGWIGGLCRRGNGP